MDAGLDSLGAVELHNELSNSAGIELPGTLGVRVYRWIISIFTITTIKQNKKMNHAMLNSIFATILNDYSIFGSLQDSFQLFVV